MLMQLMACSTKEGRSRSALHSALYPPLSTLCSLPSVLTPARACRFGLLLLEGLAYSFVSRPHDDSCRLYLRLCLANGKLQHNVDTGSPIFWRSFQFFDTTGCGLLTLRQVPHPLLCCSSPPARCVMPASVCEPAAVGASCCWPRSGDNGGAGRPRASCHFQRRTIYASSVPVLHDGCAEQRRAVPRAGPIPPFC